MAGRRAVTEGMLYDDDDDGMPIDLNDLKEEEMQALALAYGMNPEDCDEDDDSEVDDENDD